MNEREFERERSRTSEANSTAVPPGRASASANLTSPVSPIPSGILMRAAFLAAAENAKLSQDHLLRAVRLEYRSAGKLSESGTLE